MGVSGNLSVFEYADATSSNDHFIATWGFGGPIHKVSFEYIATQTGLYFNYQDYNGGAVVIDSFSVREKYVIHFHYGDV